MPTLQVYSTNGQGRREIVIPGRSAMRPFGAVQITNNVGHRQESDWPAIKAAIAAGDVVICLSGYETDVLPVHLEGKIQYGGNVRFESRKSPSWRLVDDGAYCHFERFGHTCAHCQAPFETAFALGGHVQREHRAVAQRDVALAQNSE
jgi:hypothetical protein